MSDYPMLISNKLHSFRNFVLQRYVFYTTASVFAQDYSVKSPTALCDAEDFRYF